MEKENNPQQLDEATLKQIVAGYEETSKIVAKQKMTKYLCDAGTDAFFALVYLGLGLISGTQALKMWDSRHQYTKPGRVRIGISLFAANFLISTKFSLEAFDSACTNLARAYVQWQKTKKGNETVNFHIIK